MSVKKVQQNIDLKNVRVDDPFWSHVQRLMLDTVIPYQEDVLHDRIPGVEKSHAVENFRIAAGEAEGSSTAWCSRTATWPSGWKRWPMP